MSNSSHFSGPFGVSEFIASSSGRLELRESLVQRWEPEAALVLPMSDITSVDTLQNTTR